LASSLGIIVHLVCRRESDQTFCYVSTKLACTIPGACQPNRTRMSGGRVTDHQLSINSVHGVHGGPRLSRSDYVRMPVGFHVEIATLFPSAFSLFLFLFSISIFTYFYVCLPYPLDQRPDVLRCAE